MPLLVKTPDQRHVPDAWTLQKAHRKISDARVGKTLFAYDLFRRIG